MTHRDRKPDQEGRREDQVLQVRERPIAPEDGIEEIGDDGDVDSLSFATRDFSLEII